MHAAAALATLLALAVPCASSQDAPAGVTPAPAPAPAAAAPDAPAIPLLADLDLPLDQLASWGTREFRYELRQAGEVRALGRVTLATSIERGEITLRDRVDITWDEAPHWQEVVSHGALRRELRPSSLRVRGTAEGGGDAPEVLADLDATSLRVTLGEATRTEPLPPGTVGDAALWRLVTLLPRRPGFAVRLEHVLQTARLQRLPGATLFCTGSESVELEAGPVTAHRFDATRDGAVFLSAWVDDAGRLVQACLDGRRWWVARG